jgi:hypothetical protein
MNNYKNVLKNKNNNVIEKKHIHMLNKNKKKSKL